LIILKAFASLVKKKIITKWDVHHLHYDINKTSIKGKLYETDAKTLIEHNVITLLCRPCHDIEHTAKDPNNPQHLENKYPCEICGRNERGIFSRKRNEKLDKLICRKCFVQQNSKIENQLSLF
jgi:hypothetical protein